MQTLHPYGPLAWLLHNPENLPALITALEKNPPPTFQEWIAGHHTVLLLFQKHLSKPDLAAYLASIADPGSAEPQLRTNPPASKTHRIPVIYNGPDLASTALAAHLSVEALIETHSRPTYLVRFLGFSPGFAYLEGLPEILHLPRRADPRIRVEPGAVAIGGPHAGIYTIPSPGGWHWLGHTAHPLFQPEKNDASAFLLRPGDQIKFHPVAEALSL